MYAHPSTTAGCGVNALSGLHFARRQSLNSSDYAAGNVSVAIHLHSQ
ncbi:hypothetical protein EC958_0497 [Escherichia coli O25b:H4-ST131]|uniref:Uncharacterized protein n=1 Tax=Escherichia coli O25b:H4-ST131 TaxID=941322 RepID=A0AA36KUT5_ECOLX|nr:hypothetical protein HMPREF9346_00204 [Escherichia coli MS 119-7]CDN80748.1 hypothetical protein EC958_0497 [Escherichia coli O25b:H4-ST131]